MTTVEIPQPVSPGEPAPHFTLPAVDGTARSPCPTIAGAVRFSCLLIGLWCPFCRPTIAQIGATEGKLKAEGIQALGIVATPPENARLYFKFRPTRLRLAADPELRTHQAYGLPKPTPTPEFMQAMETTRINPFGDLPEPLPVMQVAEAVAKADGYKENETDQADMERQWPQLKGQFLIDRDGIVRWATLNARPRASPGSASFPRG